MKRIQLVTVIALALFFAACSSSKEYTGVWVNKEKIQGKTFHNIFILAMTADIQARNQVESDLANAAKARGLQAVKSIDVMAPSLNDPKMPAKEDIANKLKASGCDAIFIVSLLKKEEAARYTPGTQAYSIMPTYTWSGNYFGYYSNWYPTVSTPGYYTAEKSYFIESNLYDATSEEIMWSVQSQVFNPSSLQKFSRSYMTALVKQLESEKLLKQ